MSPHAEKHLGAPRSSNHPLPVLLLRFCSSKHQRASYPPGAPQAGAGQQLASSFYFKFLFTRLGSEVWHSATGEQPAVRATAPGAAGGGLPTEPTPGAPPATGTPPRILAPTGSAVPDPRRTSVAGMGVPGTAAMPTAGGGASRLCSRHGAPSPLGSDAPRPSQSPPPLAAVPRRQETFCSLW